MNRVIVLLVILHTCVSTAHTQNLKFYSVQSQPDVIAFHSLHFYCSRDYDNEQCLKDVALLRHTLEEYPVHLLGEWSYYLVKAKDWKTVARDHGGPEVSPAFSLLLGRATVMDQSLFSSTADRIIELKRWFGIPSGREFLNEAVTHELGHAMCQDKSEKRATEYAHELRAGRLPFCETVRLARSGHLRPPKSTDVARGPLNPALGGNKNQDESTDQSSSGEPESALSPANR